MLSSELRRRQAASSLASAAGRRSFGAPASSRRAGQQQQPTLLPRQRRRAPSNATNNQSRLGWLRSWAERRLALPVDRPSSGKTRRERARAGKSSSRRVTVLLGFQFPSAVVFNDCLSAAAAAASSYRTRLVVGLHWIHALATSVRPSISPWRDVAPVTISEPARCGCCRIVRWWPTDRCARQTREWTLLLTFALG